MANYNAVKQADDGDSIHSLSPRLQHAVTDDEPESLFLASEQNKHHDHEHHHDAQTSGSALAGLVKKVRDRNSPENSYDMLDDDDYTNSQPMSPVSVDPTSPRSPDAPRQSSTQNEAHSLGDLAKAMRTSLSDGTRSADTRSPVERTVSPEPLIRSASGRDLQLSHPSPGLQSLQGAYVGNIVNLERSAEELSQSSNIAESIRRMSMELKKSDSRRSSILAATVEAMDIPSRQFSNTSNSIVETNSAARSGGYSPGGFMMSPRSSMSGPIATMGMARSVSKSSKYSRPEPEQEGRPLDSIVSVPVRDRSRKSSLIGNKNEEESTTFTREVMAAGGMDHERPTTSASTNTYDQEQTMFMDFDGVHAQDSASRGRGQQYTSGNGNGNGNRLSARPQSYADPASGQQMVYYPAPVPTMLNLPQKLSKNVGANARDKRRSQAMSTLPPQARQSAIWLPDVLETEDDHHQDNHESMEYMPQHQRRSMGGRRTMNDLQNLPPQLRASTYFEYPSLQQPVELKGDSVTATLDSILDASAHAPVSAFTDHVFAGPVGKETYGRAPPKQRKSVSNMLSPSEESAPAKKEKRRSSFLGFGRRSSSGDLLAVNKENRKSTMSSLGGSSKLRKSRLSADEDAQDEDNAQDDALLDGEDGIHVQADEEGQLDEEVYTGPPTTLLAELQLRKQQQKARTRPLTSVYATGVHSTLLEMEAVAQVQQRTRQKKQVNLAWENGIGGDDDDNDDVPLGLLYGQEAAANAAPTFRRGDNRPIGLLERKDLEDNEPLSRRRERLTGRPTPHTGSMLAMPKLLDDEEEGETLAQRVKRLKAQGGISTGLPASRPVSGDLASELMSQLGLGNEPKPDKGKDVPIEPAADEEEETLGQRRRRLQAEKEAREAEFGNGELLGAVLGASGASPSPGEENPVRPTMVKRNSLADVLNDNPIGQGRSYSSSSVPLLAQEKGRATGLLGKQERKDMRRASTLAEMQKENHRISRATSGDGGEALRSKDVKIGGLLGMRDELRHSSLGLGIQQPAPGMGMQPDARHSTMTLGTGFGVMPAQPYANQAARHSTMSFGAPLGMQQPMYGAPVQGQFSVQQPYGNMNGMGISQPQMWGQPAHAQNMYGNYMGGQGYGGQQYGMPYHQPMQTGAIGDQRPPAKDMVERWRQSVMP